MSRCRWILPSLLLLASPAWAGGGFPLATSASCNQIFADIDLPGIEGQITLTFEAPLGLAADSLDLSVELINPEDALLNDRLPEDVFIPSDFPVLIKIEPAAGTSLTFSGGVAIEIVAENLDFEANTPLRLFRSRVVDLGPFEEISQSVGSGSYRVLAVGGGFSEFVIAADLRPQVRIILKKFNRLDTLLSDNATAIDDLVEAELNGLLDAAVQAFQGDDLDLAISNLEDLIDSVVANSNVGIPDDWDPGNIDSLAGRLRSAAATLRHSLKQRRLPEPVTTGAVVAEIEIDANHALKATLSFDRAFDIDLENFDFTAELIDPEDPAYLDRLPAGVTIPSQFPVLLRLATGGVGEQSFRGEWSLEIETENLEFVGDSPLRLFKAPDGGAAFEDITRSVGLGSYRVLAVGGGFSELLIVSDLRPVDDVVNAKFDAIQAPGGLLAIHVGAITPAVLAQLAAEITQARLDYDQGALDQAIEGVKTFRDTVEANSEEDIPSLWRSDGLLVNVAGLLSSAAQTLKLSLAIKRTPLAFDPRDVNRDGMVNVQDVLFLIDQVFGDQPAP